METIVLHSESCHRPTTLYPLKPMGLGTAYVESLVSYIARLANRHSVTPSLLATDVISTQDQPLYASRWFYSDILGSGSTASRWVDRLHELTGLANLSDLTMLKWRDTISLRRLFHRTHAWCPACYAEFSQAGILYDPLLWSLSVVNQCPRHATPLLTECSDCGQSIPFLQAGYRPGFCPNCGAPLFGSSVRAEGDTSDSRQLWAATQVRDLLESASSWPAPPSLYGLITAIKILSPGRGRTAPMGAGTATRLKRMVIWGTVCLDNLLEASELLDTPLSRLLSGAPIVLVPLEAGPKRTRQMSVDLGPTTTREYCEAQLKTFLSTDEEPFPSLAEISRRIGVSAPVLRWWCPDLCREVQERRRRSRERLKAAVLGRLEMILLDESCPSVTQASEIVGVPEATLWHAYGEICKRISDRHKRKCKYEAEERRRRLLEDVRRVVDEFEAEGICPSGYQVRNEIAAGGRSVWGGEFDQAWRRVVVDRTPTHSLSADAAVLPRRQRISPAVRKSD